ncbi:MAG TPA: AI-2E family transporter [Polyangia bacterium]
MTPPYRPDSTPAGDSPWTPARVAALTAAALAVFALGRLIVAAREVILVSFLAVVVATVLCFPIDWMARRMPRWLAFVITLFAFFGLVTLAVIFIVPVVRDQIDQLPGELATARDRLQEMWSRHGGTAGASKSLVAHATQAAPRALPILKHILEGGSAIVLVIVLAFILAIGRDSLHAGVRRLVPRRHEPLFDEWWARMATTLRSWTRGVLVSMVIMGVLTGFGLWIAGIDAPLLLGLVTFFGTFVPYVGALASAIPGLAVALAQSPRHLVYALIVYVVVHHVEGYLVQPIVMRRAVRLQPALLLFWQAAIAAALGIAALLVATPLLACVQVSVGYLWIERRLGKAGTAA